MLLQSGQVAAQEADVGTHGRYGRSEINPTRFSGELPSAASVLLMNDTKV